MVIARTRTLVVAVSLSSVGISQISLVSTDAGGSNLGGEVLKPSCSSDGRFVAFHTYSLALADGVYVKDRQTGALLPVSVPAGGGNAVYGTEPSISADGSAVAFRSLMWLVPGDTNPWHDIYVRDLSAGTTERVSVSSSGVPANQHSGAPSISGDGRFVAFESAASNLVPNDTNAVVDVFVYDRATAMTQLVSATAAGSPAAAPSSKPLISADGRWVAFESNADDLLLPDSIPVATEVYVRDFVAGATFRVSLSSAGIQARGQLVNAGLGFPGRGGISPDGRWITFLGDAGLDPEHPTGGGIYVRDTVAGTTRLVSLPPPSGVQGTDTSGGAMSSDARFIAFATRDKLTADDANSQIDVFVRDMLQGTITRISRELPGQFSGMLENSGDAVITADGALVFFDSLSPRLAWNDTETNADVFEFDWSQAASVAYCTAGTSAQGCTATLSAIGSSSGSAGSGFTLRVSGSDGQRSGLLVYGVGGRQVLPWGASSFSCVTPPRQRMGLSWTNGTSGQCDGSFAVDWNAFFASHPSALGAPIGELTPIQAQAFVRDPTAPGGSVLSNALEFYAVP